MTRQNNGYLPDNQIPIEVFSLAVNLLGDKKRLDRGDRYKVRPLVKNNGYRVVDKWFGGKSWVLKRNANGEWHVEKYGKNGSTKFFVGTDADRAQNLDFFADKAPRGAALVYLETTLLKKYNKQQHEMAAARIARAKQFSK